MFSNTSSQHCQSRFYKDWHPDYIASYNSLTDRHLRNFFNHPARKTHLGKTNMVSRLYFSGFPIPAFPEIPAFLCFLFPGENSRESREIKYVSFYQIRTSNFVCFLRMFVFCLVFHDDG
jgi:hypothetical protein